MELARRSFLSSLLVAPAAAPTSSDREPGIFIAYAPPVAYVDDDDNVVSGMDLVLNAWKQLRPKGLIVLPSVFDQHGNRLFDIKHYTASKLRMAERRTIDGKECIVLPLEDEAV